MAIDFKLNGTPISVDVDPATPLLWVLRDELKLTGTKYGCGLALCGACTVHVDGFATRSCQTPLSDVANLEVVTIEGVAGQEAVAIQAAWRELDVPQCGYCQSGQIMAAVMLLVENANPSDDDISAAMDGIVCRCATYFRIRAGIHRASEMLGGSR